MSEVKYFVLKPMQSLRAYVFKKLGLAVIEDLIFSYCNYESETKVFINEVAGSTCLHFSKGANNISIYCDKFQLEEVE